MEINAPQMNTPMTGIPTPATNSLPPNTIPTIPVGAKIIAVLFYIDSVFLSFRVLWLLF